MTRSSDSHSPHEGSQGVRQRGGRQRLGGDDAASNRSKSPKRRQRGRLSRWRLMIYGVMRPWMRRQGRRSGGSSFLGSDGAGIASEVVFFGVLFLLGVFGLSLVLINRFAPDDMARISDEAFSDSLAPAFSTSLSTWIFGILSVAAIGTGVVSLVYRLMHLGASTEYRSVLANRAGQFEKDAMDFIGPTAPASATDDLTKLPSVPRGTSLTDSPGERLAYRLAAETREAGLAGPAILTFLWNAVWFILLAVAVSGFWYGSPRWILTLLLGPFAVIGYWSFKYFVTQLKQSAGIGPTIVEISQQPLCPGETCDVFVIQMGRLRLKRLRVQLVCEEETFYRQGTDVRVDRHESFVQVLCKEREVRVDPRAPWEQQLVLQLPDNIMHSFVGTHNAIRWKIVVKGESHPWPSFYRSFPVVIHPSVAPPKRSPR
ncbi:hypothetical protein Pla22_00350 [Rubripirellula amarantea]|uniref:Uncharacterized protein n=1 Tax=Rubripirellula amarantea TaxID=2527999 RepID=A0A5C5WQN2_9BACT|nr:hypothetical protein [Rubripirellula amarantea]TWT52411.1 hypothetical protein Pla22_00350 [Rubripirellula amarantea]